MKTYYHITPDCFVPFIMKNGLKANRPWKPHLMLAFVEHRPPPMSVIYMLDEMYFDDKTTVKVKIMGYTTFLNIKDVALKKFTDHGHTALRIDPRGIKEPITRCVAHKSWLEKRHGVAADDTLPIQIHLGVVPITIYFPWYEYYTTQQIIEPKYLTVSSIRC